MGGLCAPVCRTCHQVSGGAHHTKCRAAAYLELRTEAEEAKLVLKNRLGVDDTDHSKCRIHTGLSVFPEWATLNRGLPKVHRELFDNRSSFYVIIWPMPKRIKQDKRPKDVNELARYLGDVSTQGDSDTLRPTKEQVSMLMAEMGRKGGKIGGKRRLQTMTPRERSKAAKVAAQARWEKKR